MITKLKPTSIQAYIHAAPAELQERLWQLHFCITKAAPAAAAALKWNMPAYSYQKILVTFAVFKNHTGFYPMAAVIKHFSKELAAYKTAEGSVQFPHSQPLPLALISKMVKYRVKESKDGTIQWRS
ncbi:MAG: hypothetical protein RL172_57 [Bacteroidota bacterium]|jgi:uncharacterized protein YdhG (YjbR/CyaY superfamily)